MSVNSAIRSALLPFGDPVEFGEFLQTDRQNPVERYYTFNYNTLGTDYGDDAPNHEKYLIQVHFNCPRIFDSVQRVKQTKRQLFAAGFTWPETTNASDSDGQHIVFECETVEGVTFDGDD